MTFKYFKWTARDENVNCESIVVMQEGFNAIQGKAITDTARPVVRKSDRHIERTSDAVRAGESDPINMWSYRDE